MGCISCRLRATEVASKATHLVTLYISCGCEEVVAFVESDLLEELNPIQLVTWLLPEFAFNCGMEIHHHD